MVKENPNHDPILEMENALWSRPYPDPGPSNKNIHNLAARTLASQAL